MIINFSNIGSAGGSGGTYTLPIATESRLGGVKVGSGLTIDPSTGVLSASGGTNGAKTYVLSLMSQQERASLYTELLQYSGATHSASSALPIEDYYFYVWDTGNTNFKSFIPVYLAYYADDYGGSIFFAGLTASRDNNGEIYKTRFVLKSDGTFEKTNKKMSVEVEIVGLNYSWTGQLKYDADNSQFLRGSTVLDPALSHSSFESSTRMDELINKFIALDSGASNRLLTPELPFILISGGTEHKYTEPTIDGEDISAVTIDGQTYSRRYSFIYTEEDGSRFIIRMKLNSSQKATGFEYEYVANGGASGSTVSVEQTLSAGTKIATITVNGTDTDLFAPEGGGGDENYQIVNNLSEVVNPQAGTKVYVKSGSTSETWQGVAFNASTITEDFVGHVRRNDVNVWDIYKSGNNFHWNWTNDGQLHIREAGSDVCAYLSDTGNGIFNIFIEDWSDLNVNLPVEGVTTASTSTTITQTWESASYMYNGSEYVPVSDVVYVIDDMSQSEIASLVSYLLSVTEVERIGAHIYKNNTKCRYGRVDGGTKIQYECHYISNDQGFPYVKLYDFYLKSNGTIEWSKNGTDYGLPVSLWTNYNDTGHTLNAGNTPFWAIGRSTQIGSPLTIRLTTGASIGFSVVTANAINERTGNWTGNFYVTFIYDGKKIEASWSYNENTATNTSWVETSLT